MPKPTSLGRGFIACALATSLIGTACHASSPAEAEADADASSPPFGGGPVETDPFDPDAAIAARVSALFGSSSCQGGPETSCHGSAAGGLGLRLGIGGDVIGVPSTERPDLERVRPFDPLNSYLYLKVRGDGGIDGGRMPLGAAPDPRIPDLVESWVEAGAPTP